MPPRIAPPANDSSPSTPGHSTGSPIRDVDASAPMRCSPATASTPRRAGSWPPASRGDADAGLSGWMRSASRDADGWHGDHGHRSRDVSPDPSRPATAGTMVRVVGRASCRDTRRAGAPARSIRRSESPSDSGGRRTGRGVERHSIRRLMRHLVQRPNRWSNISSATAAVRRDQACPGSPDRHGRGARIDPNGDAFDELPRGCVVPAAVPGMWGLQAKRSRGSGSASTVGRGVRQPRRGERARGSTRTSPGRGSGGPRGRTVRRTAYRPARAWSSSRQLDAGRPVPVTEPAPGGSPRRRTGDDRSLRRGQRARGCRRGGRRRPHDRVCRGRPARARSRDRRAEERPRQVGLDGRAVWCDRRQELQPRRCRERSCQEGPRGCEGRIARPPRPNELPPRPRRRPLARPPRPHAMPRSSPRSTARATRRTTDPTRPSRRRRRPRTTPSSHTRHALPVLSEGRR